jgi:hypothetical protein
MLTFRPVAMIASAFCLALSVLWFADVSAYTALYGIELGEGGNQLGRRASPILLGLGVLLYLARDEAPSPLRRTVCLGAVLIFAGVGVTGLIAYQSGAASFAILVAALTEFAVAAVMYSVAQDR